MPSFERIIVMATIPVIKILVMCGIGSIIVAPPINAFPTDARKHMNKLVFLIFLPSLIFTKLSEAMTSKKLIDWWYMPLNIFLGFAIGASIGFIVVKCTKPPCHLENLTIACCAVGNTGNIPLILIPGICEEEDNPFGTNISCSLNGEAYVSFGMWMATLLVWTFIYNLMMPQSLSSRPMDFEETKQKVLKNISINDGKSAQNKTCTKSETIVYENEAMASSSKYGADDHINENIFLLQVPKNESGYEATTSNFKKTMKILNSITSTCTKASTQLCLQQIFTTPTTCAILALIIGGCASLKSILIGPHAPLRFLVETLSILGDATIPCMNLILGGNLVLGISGSSMKFQTIIGILLTRFLFLPIIGCGLVISVSSLKLIPSDPLFRFVLLLQFCMPTAINVGTIAQLHGNGEMEVSKILFWSYTTSTILLSLWIIIFLFTI